LVGVSNGSIQFATYEEIKRRRTDIKKKLFANQGKEWKLEDEKLVSRSVESSKEADFEQKVVLATGVHLTPGSGDPSDHS
jgi:hypothetical protein